MEVVVAEQTVLFLKACLFGFALGLFYEFFRILRLMVKTGTGTIFLEDLLYWSVCALISFLFILTVNSGQLRIFLLAGIIIGMIVYFFTVGTLVMRASKAIINFIRKVLRVLYKTLILPIIKLMHAGKRIFNRFTKKVESKNKIMQNNVNYSLKQYRLLLYNLIYTKKLSDGRKNNQSRGNADYEKERRQQKKKNTSRH